MKQLIELIRNLLKITSSSKVLTKYSVLVQKLRTSRRITLSKKHILFNQYHHGATQLLGYTLTPGTLAEVLVGSDSPALSTIINELKASILKGSKKAKWLNFKEVDITEKFELKGIDSKCIQSGKIGNKSPAAKIPISQRAIKL